MWNADPSQLQWRWNDREFARQKRNKGRGRWESRRMQTTGSPLRELCWGWESERRLIAALVERPGLSSPSLQTDDTAEGKRELAWGKEEKEAPVWVYKFTSYPWPNTQTVSSTRRPIITPASLSPASSSPSAPQRRTHHHSLNGQMCSPLDLGQRNSSIPNPCLSSKNTRTRLVINRYLCCD